MEFSNAVALVSGGAKGLGLVIAQHLQQQGAKVLVVDMDKDALAILPDSIEGHILDVTNHSDVQKMIRSITNAHGSINILVNNAGRISNEPMVNLMNPARMMHSYDHFRQSITSNLDSVFIMTSSVVEQMVLTRTKGIIINISSISACGNAGQTAYSAAKSGVNAMTKVWAKELGKLGIRCNAIAPGFIDTQSTHSALSEANLKYIKNNTPLRRLGNAEEVAQAVAACISNDYINGIVLDVHGGLTI